MVVFPTPLHVIYMDKELTQSNDKYRLLKIVHVKV